MTVDAEILYIFYLPMDYEELQRFERDTDTSDMKRIEDMMAVRYKKRVVATYPYKSIAEQTEPNLSDIPTTTEDCSMVDEDLGVPYIEVNGKDADCPWK